MKTTGLQVGTAQFCNFSSQELPSSLLPPALSIQKLTSVGQALKTSILTVAAGGDSVDSECPQWQQQAQRQASSTEGQRPAAKRLLLYLGQAMDRTPAGDSTGRPWKRDGCRELKKLFTHPRWTRGSEHAQQTAVQAHSTHAHLVIRADACTHREAVKGDQGKVQLGRTREQLAVSRAPQSNRSWAEKGALPARGVWLQPLTNLCWTLCYADTGASSLGNEA